MTQILIIQPETSFGDVIRDELLLQDAGQQRWHTFEFAVAWFNISGSAKICDAARTFLSNGGHIRATVGLDFGSTTYEGLSSLLDLGVGQANITTHVFHDENPACTFHPKVFIFSTVDQARLFVGSNNMTGAGLNTNVEAALRFAGAREKEPIRGAQQMLAAWRNDESEPRTLRLTRELLKQLRDQRYVLTEAEIRRRRSADGRDSSSGGEPLFGRSATRMLRGGPVVPKVSGRVALASRSAREEVLLMRVLPRRNGNQIQLSKYVLNSPFINGATEVVLTDGSRRLIGSNAARDNSANTERFEAPGLNNMNNPVARFRWMPATPRQTAANRYLQFELFDASTSGDGAEIFQRLQEGIGMPPATARTQLSQDQTVLSTSNQAHAQWYRLDLA